MSTDFQALLQSHLKDYPVSLRVASNDGERIERLCPGTATLEELLPRLDAGTLATILDSVIWLPQPVARTQPVRRRTLVLGATPEASFLAMGGYLLKHRGELDCVNAICFSDIADEAGAVFARRDEADLRARIAGFENIYLDLPRYRLRASRANPAQRNGEESQRNSEESFRNALCSLLYYLIDNQRPRDVFAPAPFGNDPDRRQLFDALLRIFEAGYFPAVSFHVYESLPEASTYSEIDSFLASVENAYIRTEEWFDDVTPVARNKVMLTGAMQALPEADRSATVESISSRNSLLAHQADGQAERFWRLRLAFGFEMRDHGRSHC